MLMGYEPSIARKTIQEETVTPEVHAGGMNEEDSGTLGDTGKDFDRHNTSLLRTSHN